MRNHQLESRVRENRTHGSEGGESVVLFPTPISSSIILALHSLRSGSRRCISFSHLRGNDGME